MCQKCGSLLGSVVTLGAKSGQSTCRLCGSEGTIKQMELPYIFKYLVTQCSSCNINLKITLTEK